MRSPVPATAASVWTPADFPREHAWSFDLGPADRAAIIAAGSGPPETLAEHFRTAAPGSCACAASPEMDSPPSRPNGPPSRWAPCSARRSGKTATPTCSPTSATNTSNQRRGCVNTAPTNARTSTATAPTSSACSAYTPRAAAANPKLSARTPSTTKLCAGHRTSSMSCTTRCPETATTNNPPANRPTSNCHRSSISTPPRGSSSSPGTSAIPNATRTPRA